MSKAKRSIIAPPEVNRRAQRNRLILYLTLFFVVVIVIAVVAFYSRVPKSASTAPIQSSIKVGDTAPDFTVSTTQGEFNLNKSLATGHPVLLEVFATWCPHCQHEVSVLDTLYRKYGNQISFLAVSGNPYGMDGSTPESQADVIKFQQEFDAKYPLAYDPSMDVAGKYLTGGYPTLVIIGKDDHVSYLTSGETPQATLTKEIEKVIK